VNLTSYAELAVRLANTAVLADGEPDPLDSVARCADAFADCVPATVTPRDLDVLLHLRSEFTAIFTAAATRNDQAAIRRLNTLLVQYPIQPELVSHDDQRWHVHLARQGAVSDQIGAGAIIGLALTVSLYGVSRLGICAIASCPRAFIDSSPNQSRRYCADHGARGNVRTLTPAQAHRHDAAPATGKATSAAS
jgi:predicted RNA-binding Zn ribbon-like protein